MKPLTKFNTSGAFDVDPHSSGSAARRRIQGPSTGPSGPWPRTSTSQRTRRTRRKQDSEPYERASAYYSSRAYGPELAWNWGTNVLHQEEYGGLIRDADEALGHSTSIIGVIIANHLLSAVDALVSGRLGIAGQTEPTLQISLLPGRLEHPGIRIPGSPSHPTGSCPLKKPNTSSPKRSEEFSKRPAEGQGTRKGSGYLRAQDYGAFRDLLQKMEAAGSHLPGEGPEIRHSGEDQPEGWTTAGDPGRGRLCSKRRRKS